MRASEGAEMEEREIRYARIRGSSDTKAADHAKPYFRVASVRLREQCSHVEGCSQTRCNFGPLGGSCAGWNYQSVAPDRAGGFSYSCRGPHAESPMRVAAASTGEVSCTTS